jgi:Ca-activated chloride channel family protein
LIAYGQGDLVLVTTLLRRVTAGLAGLAVAVPFVPTAAWAAPELAPIMVVLDASGSMAEQAPGGTKMAAAKQAVRAVVGALPEAAHVGLTVYGARTGSSAADKPAGCKDVEVVHPVTALDRTGLITAVEAAQPRGYTPIGNALRTAADALPKEGPRSIVLVSDGEDTCAPPEPCQVARDLAKEGVDLRIHAVGYQVDGKAKNQLTCIAQASGGTYTNVPDAADLGGALHRVTNSALRNYQPAGTPVTGTYTIDGAPVLTPGGYLDTLGFARKRYYSVEVAEDYTAYFAATVPFLRGGRHDTAGLNVAVYGIGGVDCYRSNNAVTSGGKDGAAVTVLLTWNGNARRASNDACKKGGRYTFAVYFTDANDGGTVAEDEADRVPVELQLGLEPPVTDAGPAAAPLPVAYTEPTGPDQPVTGGGSFGTAATLAGSGRYTDGIQFGEFVYFRIRVDWGQGVAYRVEYGLADLRRAAANIESAMYSPTRGRVAWTTTNYAGAAKALPQDQPAFTTLPIRYQNRSVKGDQTQQLQSVAGWYYIVVKLGHASDNAQHPPVPLTLKVTLVGTPEAGPAYRDSAGAGSLGESRGASAPAGGVQAKRTSDSSGLLWWIAVPVALVVIAGGAGTLLVRRRR